jgi:hypothetical protein
MGARAAIARLLAMALLLPGTAACLGCPAALLDGTLAARDGELVVVTPDAPPVHLEWPFGYSVREVDGRLSAVDLFGTVKAAEGDMVRVGGGMGADGTWSACGDLEVIPAPSPQEA